MWQLISDTFYTFGLAIKNYYATSRKGLRNFTNMRLLLFGFLLAVAAVACQGEGSKGANKKEATDASAVLLDKSKKMKDLAVAYQKAVNELTAIEASVAKASPAEQQKIPNFDQFLAMVAKVKEKMTEGAIEVLGISLNFGSLSDEIIAGAVSPTSMLTTMDSIYQPRIAEYNKVFDAMASLIKEYKNTVTAAGIRIEAIQQDTLPRIPE